MTSAAKVKELDLTNLKLPIALTIVTVLIGLGLQLWYWPQLPERMAIHFDINGNPNDWLDKSPATLLSVGLMALLPAFFIGISQAISWLPSSLINMPYREYWLAAERRETSLQWMTGWMLWFSVTMAIFLLVTNHLTFVANRDAQPLPPVWFGGSLVAFLSSTCVMILLMLNRFRKPTQLNG